MFFYIGSMAARLRGRFCLSAVSQNLHNQNVIIGSLLVFAGLGIISWNNP
ncbi:hypothetical protein [Sulfuricaulis sp.]|nr:hypothetical protein [Sulfuricaulis sp.]